MVRGCMPNLLQCLKPHPSLPPPAHPARPCSYVEAPYHKAGTQLQLVVRGKKNAATVGAGAAPPPPPWGRVLLGACGVVGWSTDGCLPSCTAAVQLNHGSSSSAHPGSRCCALQVTKMPFVNTTYYKPS
jgi:hypothetical protein